MTHWSEIEAWAKERLASARDRNDGDLGEIETAHLRGRIATLKELLALPETKRSMDAQVKSVLPD